MMTARLFNAAQPVAPTTAAIAPNAPIGAAHMIIARMRKTRRWRCSMPRRIGAPFGPSFCSANPTSSATSRVCRTSPSVKAETRVFGMMPSRKSTGPSAPVADFWTLFTSAGLRCSPVPGCRMLPTTRPIAKAKVDMTMK